MKSPCVNSILFIYNSTVTWRPCGRRHWVFGPNVESAPGSPELQERDVSGSRGPICAHYLLLFFNVRVIIIATTIIVW